MKAQSNQSPRQQIPHLRAVIDQDSCTGCEACLEVCPVACIELRIIERGVKGVQAWCEVDWDRCIGCELCIHIPRKKSDPYEMLVCPWEAISMARTLMDSGLPGFAA